MNPEEFSILDLGGCDNRDGCATVNYQYANISIPVEVVPKTKVGEITIECCDEPCIECVGCECKGGLDLVITQKVCIKIPVKYQIEACAKEESISCD